MKALIELAPRGSIFEIARNQLKPPARGADGPAAYRLRFESARALFAELTPARIELLEALRRHGPCPVYALAQDVGRDCDDAHGDVAKLEAHGLVQRTPDDLVFVPFESVEIHLTPRR
ncbi:MAG: HVO_A0114 family putative DNA-binding protein [Ramlibacter sp.]